MVYWITGRKHSGKTTLAKKLLAQIPDSVLVDGDEVRSWFPEDYTDEGRVRNQATITKIAHILEDQGLVPIIACVSPVKNIRKHFQKEFKNCLEIQLPFGELWEGTTYEE